MTAQGSPLPLIVHLSLEGGVVALAILLTRAVLRRRLPPRWRCILWLLLGARLLLPVSFESRFSLFNLPGLHAISPPSIATQKKAYAAEDDAQALAADAQEVGVAPSFNERPAPSVTAAARPWYAMPWVWGAIWFAGFAGVLGLLMIRSVRWAARLAGSSPFADARLEEVARECGHRLGVSRPPPIHECRHVTSPVLCGMLRPRILLPPRFTESYEWEDIRFVLMHEMAHLKRRDLVLAWILAGLQAVHWFNPLVWLGFSRWRADRELACDATVLAAVGGGQSRRYGAAILRLVEKSGPPAAVPCGVGALAAPADLHQRLSMVIAFEATPRWSWRATLAVTALGLICLSDASTRMGRSPPPTTARSHQAEVVSVAPVLPAAALRTEPTAARHLAKPRAAVAGVVPLVAQAHFRATSLTTRIGLTPVQRERVEGMLVEEIAARHRMGSTASSAAVAAMHQQASDHIRQMLRPVQRLEFNLTPQALGGGLVGPPPEARLELLDRLVRLRNEQKTAALTVYVTETYLVMEHRAPAQAAMVRKIRSASLRRIRNLLTPEQRLVWDRTSVTKGGGIPNVSAKRQVDKLDDVAHLTGDQRRGALRICEDTIAAWEDLPWEERNARLPEYRKALGVRICAMLTPAQQHLVNGVRFFGAAID